MLHPFRWWHVFISIVPLSIIDVIEAPVPVMLGLIKEEYETLEIKDIENRMWINLDKDQIVIGNPILDDGESFIYEPYLNGMKRKLESIFQEMKLIDGNHLNDLYNGKYREWYEWERRESCGNVEDCGELYERKLDQQVSEDLRDSG